MNAVEAGMGQETQLVVFSLYGEEFGIEITQVREIIKPREITRLPHTPDFIKGVTNIRGEVIPVIDLRQRFGVEAATTDQDSRIIITELNDSRVGFIVDSVAEVLRIPRTSIEPPPRTIAGLRANYIQGIGRVDERLLIVLDVTQILTSEEQISLEPKKLSEQLSQLEEQA
ncbi:MAG: purine-binding chemotaxis protein CheW [Firmicutes bacterium]|nr:purine-binding chemotaxis protein CheW [Bacillota bacterium]